MRMACRSICALTTGRPLPAPALPVSRPRLAPLSARFIKLGIGLQRITPGKPQQNGSHERFHLTMLPLARRQSRRAASGFRRVPS